MDGIVISIKKGGLAAKPVLYRQVVLPLQSGCVVE
jgi:hypothetical protein